MDRPAVVVIGAGISGLSAAHALSELARANGTPVDIAILEATSVVGGKLATHEVDGVRLDAGAESVLARRPEGVQLIADVGLSGEQEPQAESGVGVLVNGQLHQLPKHQLLGIPFDYDDVAQSGLLDGGGLADLKRDGTMPPASADTSDVSIGELVRSRMGHQVLDRLVEPLLGGIYAGQSDQISADMAVPGLIDALAEHGSLMAAVASLRAASTDEGPLFVSLRGGLGRLPQAIVDATDAEVHTSTKARNIVAAGDRWRVIADSPEGSREFAADAVIVSCPAASAASLLSHMGVSGVASALAVEYASVALVTYLFRVGDIPELPAGSGFVVPPGSSRLVKAATYASQKWSWLRQEQPDLAVVRVSIGRFGETGWRREDADLAAAALREFHDIAKTGATPVATKVRHWERSLPQYRVGHRARITELQERLTALRGLEICGAALDGVGVPACIASGQLAAGRVAQLLGVGGE